MSVFARKSALGRFIKGLSLYDLSFLYRSTGPLPYNKQRSLMFVSVLGRSQRNTVHQMSFACCQKRSLSSSSKKCSNSDCVTVVYQHGLPVITLPLPSKSEKCAFTLRPLSSTVGQFLSNLMSEDRGIDTAVIHQPDGVRVSSSTQIEHLLSGKFHLTINNTTYDVFPPPMMDGVSSEHIAMLDDLKQIIARLHDGLNIQQYCLKREQDTLGRLEELKSQLEPLEKLKQDLDAKASFRTNLVIWGGMAYMAIQFGVLARLTWWEYSWDIMEPVTYFITYGTAMIMYGYFILTKQEYLYPDARDRQFLRFLHKAAESSKFDISKYNHLCDEISRAEKDLVKYREPLQSSQRPVEKDGPCNE